ncbi:MAG: hypothetical protein FJX25_16690 [Alphaproteobacteria bacterium]|nr:hypothetical protein [Alphaproteobacteria bacterium]
MKIRTVALKHAGRRCGSGALVADIYEPPGGRPPHGYVIWLHSGDLLPGREDDPPPSKTAAHFTACGYGFVSLHYQAAHGPGGLSDKTERLLPYLVHSAMINGCDLQRGLVGWPALAAAEECLTFLHWAWKNLGSRPRFILGGSSLGAITAMNVTLLGRLITGNRPPISAVIALSGSFWYYDFIDHELLHQDGTRFLALHNPRDPLIPVTGIRAFQAHGAAEMKLLESADHRRGSWMLHPQESLAQGIGRVVAWFESEPGVTGQGRRGSAPGFRFS